MKIHTFMPFVFILASSLAASEPAMDENMDENIKIKEPALIQQTMKDLGWSLEGLTTTELGSMTVFQRKEKVVGYCVVESDWKPIPPEERPLSGVTKIEFGDPTVPPDGYIWFAIEDPAEISLWVAAYRNNSRSSLKMLRFVRLAADAGFQNATIKINYVTGHGCHQGLYFYNGDKKILVIESHWDEASKAGKPSSNEVLQSLVLDRIRKERDKEPSHATEQSDCSKSIHPPNTTQPKVEQPADGKTPEAPQPPH